MPHAPLFFPSPRSDLATDLGTKPMTNRNLCDTEPKNCLTNMAMGMEMSFMRKWRLRPLSVILVRELGYQSDDILRTATR